MLRTKLSLLIVALMSLIAIGQNPRWRATLPLDFVYEVTASDSLVYVYGSNLDANDSRIARLLITDLDGKLVEDFRFTSELLYGDTNTGFRESSWPNPTNVRSLFWLDDTLRLFVRSKNGNDKLSIVNIHANRIAQVLTFPLDYIENICYILDTKKYLQCAIANGKGRCSDFLFVNGSIIEDGSHLIDNKRIINDPNSSFSWIIEQCNLVTNDICISRTSSERYTLQNDTFGYYKAWAHYHNASNSSFIYHDLWRNGIFIDPNDDPYASLRFIKLDEKSKLPKSVSKYWEMMHATGLAVFDGTTNFYCTNPKNNNLIVAMINSKNDFSHKDKVLSFFEFDSENRLVRHREIDLENEKFGLLGAPLVNLFCMANGNFVCSISSYIDPASQGKMSALYMLDSNLCATADCHFKGCTDTQSLNFQPDAIIDDGSCVYSQCDSGQFQFTISSPDVFHLFIGNPSNNTANNVLKVIGMQDEKVYLNKSMKDLCNHLSLFGDGTSEYADLNYTLCLPDNGQCYKVFVDMIDPFSMGPKSFVYRINHTENIIRHVHTGNESKDYVFYLKNKMELNFECFNSKSNARDHLSALVYPNPTAGELKVILPSLTSDWYADRVNGLGQTIAEYELKSLETTLSLPDVEHGVYFLKLGNSQNPEEFQVVPVIYR